VNRKLVVIIFASLLLVLACSRTNKPAFSIDGEDRSLAIKLAEIDGRFDPEINHVFISTKSYIINAAALIHHFRAIGGAMTSQLESFSPEHLSDLSRETAIDLIERKLLANAAKKAGYEPDTAQINRFLENEFRKIGGKENYFRRIQSTGIDYNYYLKNLEDNDIIERYLRRETEKQVPGEELLHEIWDEARVVNFRHILIRARGLSDDNKLMAKRFADTLAQRISNGEKLADLARTYSDDAKSRANGGEYKNIRRGMVEPVIEDYAFSMKTGEISPVFESRYGFHILELISREANFNDFETEAPGLGEEYFQSMKNRTFNDILNRLFAEEKLRIHN